RFEMRWKIDAAAFFRRLDQQDASRERHALRFESGDGCERAEDRIAIVRCATAIQLAFAQHGLPGAEARHPTGELGLLVEVAIEQHRSRKLAGNIDQQYGRAARER